jgi:hypothetical protein
MKVTEPFGMPLGDESVAVSITDCPYTGVLMLVAIEVVVVNLLGTHRSSS